MADQLDLLTQSFTQYVVTPLNAFGLGGFVFDVEGDTTHNLSSEISDHYLEDNSSVQDQIALRPKKITLKRYVGELVYQQDDSITTQIQQVVQKLTTLSSFLPVLSQGAQQIQNLNQSGFSSISNIFSNASINQVTNLWATVQNLAGLTSRQEQAYMYLKALQEAKILCSVQTPFEFLTNMAIETVVAVQAEDSKYVADFTITMKQMRFAQLISVPSGTVSTVKAGDVNAALPDVLNSNTNTPASTSTAQSVPAVMAPIAAAQNAPGQKIGNLPGSSVNYSDVINRLIQSHPNELVPPKVQ